MINFAYSLKIRLNKNTFDKYIKKSIKRWKKRQYNLFGQDIKKFVSRKYIQLINKELK